MSQLQVINETMAQIKKMVKTLEIPVTRIEQKANDKEETVSW